MSEEKKIPETLNIDEFNPKKAELVTLADSAKKALSVEIVDSKSYEEVHQAQMTLRDARINIEKTWKGMRENALAFQRKVIEVEKELIDVISPIEEELKAKKEAYNKAIEEKKAEEARKAEEEFNNRVQELAKYGYIHPDSFDLKTKSDEDFQSLLTEKKTAWEEAEKVRIEEENRQSRKADRMNKIFSLWMFFNWVVYTHSAIQSLALDEKFLVDAEDAEFEKSFNFFKETIEEFQRNTQLAWEEQLKKQKELKDREDAIAAKEAEQARQQDEKKRQEELEQARKDAAEQAKKDTEERMKREQEEKERKEKEEAEAKRQKEEQEKKDAEEKENQEKIKMEKAKRYNEFLVSIGYKKEEVSEWHIIDTDEGRVFYKKMGTYLK